MPMKPKETEARTGRFWVRLFDLLAPRFCVMCNQRLGETEEFVCLSCLLSLPRTGFASNPADNEMAQLFWGRVPVERAAAWFYYQAAASPSRLIHALKYFGHGEIGGFIGRMAAEEILPTRFFEGIDMLVPIPLTRRRQRQRGYNQSREIAMGISHVTGIPVLSSAVVRTRFEQSQTHKNAAERLQNVEGVFELTDANAVRGRHLLVIDDVVTTGATMISCCQELIKAPDVRLSVLSMGFTK